MRWIGILIVCAGFGVYVVSTAIRDTVVSAMTKVQLVDGENLIGSPMLVQLPGSARRVKGTGPEGSVFVEISSVRGVRLLTSPDIEKAAALARMGGAFMALIGMLGLGFERWRAKTGEALTGPGKLR